VDFAIYGLWLRKNFMEILQKLFLNLELWAGKLITVITTYKVEHQDLVKINCN
jgi:hypothetical protein